MIWDFLLGSVPPWVWLVLAAVIVAVIVGVLKGDGWKWAFGVAAVGLAAFFQSRAVQRGRAIEQVKQQNADRKAEQTVDRNRNANANKSEDELDKEIERWTRHD